MEPSTKIGNSTYKVILTVLVTKVSIPKGPRLVRKTPNWWGKTLQLKGKASLYTFG